MSQRTWVFLAVVLLISAAFNLIPYTSSLPEFARRGPANGGNPFQPQIPACDYSFTFAPDLLTPERLQRVTELRVYAFGPRGEIIVREVLPVSEPLPELRYMFTTRLDAITVLFIDAQGQQLGRTSLVLPKTISSSDSWTFTRLQWTAQSEVH